MPIQRPLLRPMPAALAALCLLTLTGTGAAESTFTNTVPNAGECATCHTSPPTLNDFGLDVQATLAGGQPDWSALWDLDSDGDGQTNGQELGDPCGDWALGLTPGRTADLSLPGDASDTSSAPDTPACGSGSGGTTAGTGGTGTTGGSGPVTTDGGAAGENESDDDDDDDDSGCSCTVVGSEGRHGERALGMLGVLGLFWLRRRQ